ncbi:hypothetical protein AHF37_01843 [Paragonimus kellicotti]|nr:hypothetical protein AHF37_01843 [Paragonimus kellicotti]
MMKKRRMSADLLPGLKILFLLIYISKLGVASNKALATFVYLVSVAGWNPAGVEKLHNRIFFKLSKCLPDCPLAIQFYYSTIVLVDVSVNCSKFLQNSCFCGSFSALHVRQWDSCVTEYKFDYSEHPRWLRNSSTQPHHVWAWCAQSNRNPDFFYWISSKQPKLHIGLILNFHPQ